MQSLIFWIYIYIAQICSSHSRLQLFALFDYLYMRTPVKLNQKGRKCLHAKLVPNNYDLCMCMILTSKVNWNYSYIYIDYIILYYIYIHNVVYEPTYVTVRWPHFVSVRTWWPILKLLAACRGAVVGTKKKWRILWREGIAPNKEKQTLGTWEYCNIYIIYTYNYIYIHTHGCLMILTPRYIL